MNRQDDEREHHVAEADDHLFGVCPHCGGSDGYVNLGRAHWHVCHKHRVKWCSGFNLFSSWRRETEADWRANREGIAAYEEVLPS